MKRPTLPLLFLLLFCICLSPTAALDIIDEEEFAAITALSAQWAAATESVQVQDAQPVHTREPRAEVNEALSILRKIRPPTTSKLARFVRKPKGFLGSLVYYAKETFVLLFMNAPKPSHHITTASSEQAPKLGQPLSQAVKLLKDAARDQDPDAIYLLAEMNFHGNYSHPIDYNEAFERYKQLSDQGNSSAQHRLGFLAATGLAPRFPRNQAKSMMYHTFAAEGGNTRSEMTLAYRHFAGIATPKNCDKAAYWYKKVADKAIAYYTSGPPGGRSLAQSAYRIADKDNSGVYGEGASVASAGRNAKRGGPTSDAYADVGDVLEYLHLQSAKGDLSATFSLAKLHYDGSRGVKQDMKIAKSHFMDIAREYWTSTNKVRKEASAGTERLASKAAGYIGRMFFRGEGMEQSYSKAKIWFQRGLGNGDALCQYSLGLMYLHGYGVPQDTVKAAEFLAAAADQDMAVAQTNLGKLHLDQGEVTTASKYFELAARNSHIEAFYYLAELNDKAIGRDRSCGAAVGYYKTVIEKAEPIWSTLSEAKEAYEDGETSQALVQYLMAAEQGCEAAQANVAWILDQTLTKPRWSPLNWLSPTSIALSNSLGDGSLALINWIRSAKQYNIDSWVKMGDYYFYGIGATLAPERAAICYHTAADTLQSAQAMWNLGWMHENGVGLPQDFHLAKRFYDMALDTNLEAYLPVKLSLFRLRWRSWWNGVTNGDVHGIEDEPNKKKSRSFTEWFNDFLEADAAYYAKENEAYEADDWETQHDPMPGGDEYWDADGEIDDGVMEILLIGGLLASLAWLVYYRHQRLREAEQQRQRAQQGGGVVDANVNAPLQDQPQQDVQQDRGLFPPPGDPRWNDWVAGGVGH